MTGYALLWSHSQGCFHVESVADMCRKNLQAYALDNPMDYIALAVFDTADECHVLADALIRRRDAS